MNLVCLCKSSHVCCILPRQRRGVKAGSQGGIPHRANCKFPLWNQKPPCISVCISIYLSVCEHGNGVFFRIWKKNTNKYIYIYNINLTCANHQQVRFTLSNSRGGDWTLKSDGDDDDEYHRRLSGPKTDQGTLFFQLAGGAAGSVLPIKPKVAQVTHYVPLLFFVPLLYMQALKMNIPTYCKVYIFTCLFLIYIYIRRKKLFWNGQAMKNQKMADSVKEVKRNSSLRQVLAPWASRFLLKWRLAIVRSSLLIFQVAFWSPHQHRPKTKSQSQSMKKQKFGFLQRLLSMNRPDSMSIWYRCQHKS